MKKIKVFLLSIFFVLLTGCSNYEMTMNINKNKSMNLSLIVFTETNYDNLISEPSLQLDKLEKNGYSVKEYIIDNKNGLIISKEIDNIDSISNGKKNTEFNLLYFYNDEYSIAKESEMFNVEKSFLSNKYFANFYVNLMDLNIDFNNSNVVFKLFVPNGTESNNADLVSSDGKELTWNISSLEKNEIDFVFSLKSYDYIYYGVAILIVIILIFCIIGSLFTKSGDVHNKIENDDVIKNTNNNSVDMNVVSTKNIVNNNTINNNNKVNNNANFSNKNVQASKNINQNHVGVENTDFKFNNNSHSVVNSLVPELNRTNYDKVNVEKKKGLFARKKQKNVDNNSVEVNSLNNSVFSNVVNNVNNNTFVDNKDVSLLNVNSQNVQINSVEKLEQSSDIPVVGGDYMSNGQMTNNNQQEVKSTLNPNLNINTINHNNSLNDSFTYYNDGVTSKESEEVNNFDDDHDIDAPVIMVNNSSFVVNKKENE